MSTCIERGFYLTSLQPKYTGLLRPIGIGEKFLLGLRILSNLRPSLLPSSFFPLPSSLFLLPSSFFPLPSSLFPHYAE